MAVAPHRPAPSRRRRALRALAAVAVALLLVEAVARVFLGNLSTLDILDLSPGDGRCLALRPGARADYTGWMLRIPAVTHDVNGLGYRGEEVPPGEGTGEGTVAVLGDSFAYGHGVEEAQSMPAALQAALRERVDGGVRVLNFGLPGASLEDDVLQYRHFASRWKAGLVLLLLADNDLEPSICRTAASAWQSVRHVYLLRLLMSVVNLGALLSPGEKPPSEPPQDRLRQALEALAADVAGHGGRLAVAVLGDPLAGGRYDHGRRMMERSACDVLGDLGIPWLDLGRDCGPTRDRSLPTIPREGHFTAGSNAILAADVADWLAGGALVSAGPAAASSP